ncbi:hypothetical protein F2P81_000197 [Scophthalmus maximus]|uniref:Uncharacterized protein n=1 Tax=Scophthalmus maximus TaxID=52904 RepID=A0A6A4TTL5_SCOMX|nr:hypothetical protein F2P81_000197 [Scophthalmus maximus]
MERDLAAVRSVSRGWFGELEVERRQRVYGGSKASVLMSVGPTSQTHNEVERGQRGVRRRYPDIFSSGAGERSDEKGEIGILLGAA